MSGTPDQPFVLYGTAACHLCELAEALLEALQRDGAGFEYRAVDISESEVLLERYGVRIPVLRHPDGRELGWPFSADQLSAFVG